jgi:hypothetical protein
MASRGLSGLVGPIAMVVSLTPTLVSGEEAERGIRDANFSWYSHEPSERDGSKSRLSIQSEESRG